MAAEVAEAADQDDAQIVERLRGVPTIPPRETCISSRCTSGTTPRSHPAFGSSGQVAQKASKSARACCPPRQEGRLRRRGRGGWCAAAGGVGEGSTSPLPSRLDVVAATAAHRARPSSPTRRMARASTAAMRSSPVHCRGRSHYRAGFRQVHSHRWDCRTLHRCRRVRHRTPSGCPVRNPTLDCRPLVHCKRHRLRS